jgi:hypothetical protein
MAKRGKWSGAKAVYRRPHSLETRVVPAGQEPPGVDGAWDSLLKPLTRAGQVVRDLPRPRTIREHVLDQLRWVSLDVDRRRGERSDF